MTTMARLSDSDFGRLSHLITSACGIKMPAQKLTMVQTRLMRRLRHLGISTLGEYCKYLFSDEGMSQELVHTIDAITTNKTDFFREPAHFEYLNDVVLPRLVEEEGPGFRRPLRVWSAGCATGEEPYSLAMTFSEFGLRHPDFKFHILGTDISTKALDKARLGIYDAIKAESVPGEYKKKYLLKSKYSEKKLIRVNPAIRKCVEFAHLNLMAEVYNIKQDMDIIFFRNVMIYFERPTQEAIINRLCGHLLLGGRLFVGHSETLTGMNVPLKQSAPTIYRRY